MIFIVDANIIFSGLLKDGSTREMLIDSPFTLYAPDIAIDEILKYEQVIIERSGISKEEFNSMLHLLTQDIEVIEKEKYEKFMDEARIAMKNIDEKDAPFLALALAIPNDGIWTDDAHFDKQSKVKVWKTKEIIDIWKKFFDQEIRD